MKNLYLRYLSYLVNILLFIFIFYNVINYLTVEPEPVKDLFTSEELRILLKDYYLVKLQDAQLRSNIINILLCNIETKELLENMTATLRTPTLYHFIQDYWHQDIGKTIIIAVMQKGIGVAYPSTVYYWTNLSQIYKKYQNNYEELYNEALADLLVFLLESQSLSQKIIDLMMA